MSARKKLNSLYTSGTIVLAAFVGLVFNAWFAFVVAFVILMALNTHAGNVRWAAGRRY